MRAFLGAALSAVMICGALLTGAAAEPEWKNFPAQQEFLRRKLSSSTEYRNAVDAWRRARREVADAVLAACRSVPEVREAWSRLLLGCSRLAAQPENPERNSAVIAASRELRRALAAVPGVAGAERNVAAAAGKSAELIRRAGGKGTFPPGNGLFDGAFDALGETPVLPEEARAGFLRWMERKVLEEHPDSNPRLLRRLLTFRRTPMEAVHGEAPDGEEPLAEPVDELFRILTLAGKKQIPPGAAAAMIEELSPELGPFTRTVASGIGSALPASPWRYPDTAGFRWDLMRLYRDGVMAPEDGGWFLQWLEEGLASADFAALADVPGLNRDPWLAAMVAGRVALDRAAAAASRPLSGSGAKRKAQLEERRKQAAEIARAAQREFERAFCQVPERTEPLPELIRAGAFTQSSPAERAALFRAQMRGGSGEYDAFRQLAESLLSPPNEAALRLVAELACAALDSGRIDTAVPVYGFELLALPGARRWDYCWQKSYLQPGVAVSGDRLFDCFEAAKLSKRERNLLLANRMLFEMATLRYDRALKTRKRIPLQDAELAALLDSPGVPEQKHFPRMTVLQNPVGLLKLFTGKEGKTLCGLEREFLKGNRKAPEKLAAWLRARSLPPEERDLLIDLYGRWRLPRGVHAYTGGTGKSDAFRVALRCGRSDLMAEMVRMGYRYDRFSAWPGESAWLIARNGRDPALFDVLKKAGDPLNRPDPAEGKTPLHMACVRSDSAMIAKLLALGVPRDRPDHRGRTPLAQAAASGNAAAVEQLLKAGVDCNRPARGGVTPLMVAIRSRCPRRIWEPLLQRTARIDGRDRFGRTALHYAAEYSEDPELVKALLARGASRELRDRRDRIPAELAAEQGRQKIAALLRP